MRKYILIPALLFCLYGVSQVPQGAKESKDILAFIDANIGKKVAGGYCFDLLVKAQDDIHFFRDKWKRKGRYRVHSPKPGDAIEFFNVEYDTGKGYNMTAKSHIGIVYEVLGGGNIIIADQNVGVSKIKNSKVILRQFNYKKIIKGKIKFYRFN